MNGRWVNLERQYRLPWATFSLSQGRRRFSHKIEGRGKIKRKESGKGEDKRIQGKTKILEDQAAKTQCQEDCPSTRWFVSLSYDLLDQND